METTMDRVFRRLAKIKKKPVRAKIKSIKRVGNKPDKYSTMLKKMEDHFGKGTVPILLDFIADERNKSVNLNNPTPAKTTGKYKLIKQQKS